MSRIRKLSEMLEEYGTYNHEEIDNTIEDNENKIDEKDVAIEKDTQILKDICIECEDHISEIFCEQCHDYFCQLCCESQHRKGNRKNHTFQLIAVDEESNKQKNIEHSSVNVNESLSNDEDEYSIQSNNNNNNKYIINKNICMLMDHLFTFNILGKSIFKYDKESNKTELNSNKEISKIYLNELMERSKYIPIRLTYEERKSLRLLEAALNVSNYTSKLDQEIYINNNNHIKRDRMMIQELCGLLTGLALSVNYNAGEELLENKNYSEAKTFYQSIFELGRRYKIMNSEKLRRNGEYGKLMYILQDLLSPSIKELLDFSIYKPIKTVYDVLKDKKNGLLILQDPKIVIATNVVSEYYDSTSTKKKKRNEIQKEIKMKEKAIRFLSNTYSNNELSKELIEQCLYSIGDNNYHLYYERDPIDKMIFFLKYYFKPTIDTTNVNDLEFSLAIISGNEGARLSHSNEKQYLYVLQSLTLWREIAHDFYRLWYLTDQDLLCNEELNNKYKLENTGQGIHRIQNAPKISRAMHILLHETQRKINKNNQDWIGSSVIHLGDKNVPNALLFIDKYTQIGYILRPIIKVIMEIDDLCNKNNNINYYIIHTFQSIERLKKIILCDFFKEAFDGSGADNFFDAGSCIDGRLTSTWNWCHNLEHKSFYHVFKLTGFIGFDGKFG